MSSQNIPVRRECTAPGKACYQVWRTNFEIDEKYVPIKAIGKGGERWEAAGWRYKARTTELTRLLPWFSCFPTDC